VVRELGLNMVERVTGDAERGKHLLARFFSFALLLLVVTPGKTAA
jgi:hypothetical protein